MTEATRQKVFAALLLLLFAVAFALRLPNLARRPVHADESVHAAKFDTLWQTGDYRYDPDEFHGPTLYYATLPVMTLAHRAGFADTRITDYRLVPALFGAALVLLVPLFTDALGGRRAALAAAALFAVSPAFTFYSDYYIQETLFVFFTVAAIGCGWRGRQCGSKCGSRGDRASWWWMVGVGVCAGLAVASKETVVLTLGAVVGAILFRSPIPPAPFPTGRKLPLWEGGVDVQSSDVIPLVESSAPPSQRGSLRPVGKGAGGIGLSLLTAALCLTDLFRHPAALLDYARAFAPWLHRGAETDLHRHAWSYYLGVLFWTHPTPRSPVFSEAFVGALALVGAGAAFARGEMFTKGLTDTARAFLRFLALYTLILLIAYSAIPYKTPWCILSIDAGLILLAGAGVSALWRMASARGVGVRAVVVALLAAGTTQLGWQAWRDASPLCADPRNPYVYAGTAPDIGALVQRIDDVAQARGDGTSNADATAIQVCASDGYYWPLPWYLRRYARVGYYTGLPPTGEAAAPIVVASTDLDDALTARLGDTHLMTGYFALRNGVLVEVWVRLPLWQKYIDARKAHQ